MTLTEAFAALGLAPGATPAEVRAAYVALGKAAHPDLGGTVAAFVRHREAYEVASAYAKAEPCQTCKGSATIWVGTSAWSPTRMVCASCAGSGKRHN